MVLFTVAQTRKQSKCPLTDENTKCNIYPYNGISLKYNGNELLICVIVWINLGKKNHD
jgi:hypothetical protein